MSDPAAPPSRPLDGRPPVPGPGAADRPRRGVVRGVALLLGMVVAVLAGIPVAAAPLPGRVVPDAAGAGADVTVSPSVVRAADGRATFGIDLGEDAPGDVVVVPVVRVARTDAAGTVTPGEDLPAAHVTAGSRLRPGERLVTAVELPPDAPPAVLVVEVTPAGADADAEPLPASALVLSGPVGPPPTASVTSADGVATVTVAAAQPLIVSVRTAGATTTTHPSRLVRDDAPLRLETGAATWPLPTTVQVTDEAGRTVTASTGRGPLVAIVAIGIVTAAAALTLAVRARRRNA